MQGRSGMDAAASGARARRWRRGGRVERGSSQAGGSRPGSGACVPPSPPPLSGRAARQAAFPGAALPRSRPLMSSAQNFPLPARPSRALSHRRPRPGLGPRRLFVQSRAPQAPPDVRLTGPAGARPRHLGQDSAGGRWRARPGILGSDADAAARPWTDPFCCPGPRVSSSAP